MMFRRLLFLFALLFLPALAEARGIEPQLVAEGPAPPGGEVELAIHMRTNPGWHGYWLNPGDAGLPMDVKWQLPKGFSAGPLRYPVPTRLEGCAELPNRSECARVGVAHEAVAEHRDADLGHAVSSRAPSEAAQT